MNRTHKESLPDDKPILDACCGSGMFWFNKDHPDAIWVDNREVNLTLCDGRKLEIKPDIIADFTDLPFEDGAFKLVVFDPPHLLHAGDDSWLAQKYGKLPDAWKPFIKAGFDECMRVLDDYGVLVFKWSEVDIKVRDIIKTVGQEPLFGNRRSGKAHWMLFMKGVC
jgi:hypothetical protein